MRNYVGENLDDSSSGISSYSFRRKSPSNFSYDQVYLPDEREFHT